MEHRLEMAWTSQRDREPWDHEGERWPPFASLCLATATSTVLWAMIIEVVQRVLQLV